MPWLKAWGETQDQFAALSAAMDKKRKQAD